MGYYSSLDGELAIEPPLKWREYRDSVFLTGEGVLLVLRESIYEENTDEGTVTVRTAVAVEPAHEDDVKAHTLTEELGAVAEAFGNGHTFAGYIVRKGEDQGDVERYWIEGTTPDGPKIAKSEMAELRWPDGSAVNPR